MITVAKIKEGKLAEVIRITDTVAFSQERGWVLLCMDFQQPKFKQQNLKWVRANTRFEWIRTFNFDKEQL